MTVFTNASLIDETHVRLFKEYPPRQVDVSIYGMSEEVHRGVAGVEGMSERVIRSVRAMHCAGLRVGLKTVALKENGSEVAAMRRLAEELGVRFRFDVCVAPTLDGGRMPVSHRLPVQEAVALEMAEGGRKGRSGQERGRDSGKTGGGSLYVCSAGRSMAFVGPDGSVSPCPMATHRRYGSACDSFGSAWDRMVHDIRALQADKDSACVNCTKSVYCGHCPAFCYLDVGSESEPSPYLCEIGEARRLAFEGF